MPRVPYPFSEDESDTASPSSSTDASPGSTTTREAREHFQRNNNNLTVLLSMAIGLDDPTIPGAKMMDVSDDTRFPQTKKKQWNPALKDLLVEVRRRKLAAGNTSITNKSMRKKKALTFLQDNPLTLEEDKKFVLQKVREFIHEVEAAKQEKSGTESPHLHNNGQG